MALLAGRLRRPPEPPAPVTAFGLLDGIPPPYGPDLLVFGGWRPRGAVPSDDTWPCEPCGARGTGGRCWCCGQPGRRPW